MAVFTASHKGRLSARTNSGGRETNLFTYYLLKALSGLGDVNNDGIDDSRNWFATQIGYSRLFNLNAGYKNSSGKKIQRNFKGLLNGTEFGPI